jgi:hypothetical protein
MDHQVIQRPFIMLVSTGNPNRQGSTALVYQKMNFAALFGPVGGIVTRFAAAQGRRARSAVYSLPFPLNTPLAPVETEQRTKNLLPNPLLLPGLKAFMQDTARSAKPLWLDGFPLATRPQDIPDAIHDGSVGLPRTTWSRLAFLVGKVLFGNSPHLSWHSKVVRAFWFCGILFHDASRLVLVWENRILSRMRLFVQLLSIFG